MENKKIDYVSDGKGLLENILLIDISTWQDSKQVYSDWKTGEPAKGVNTANLGIYRLVDGNPVFNLIGKEGTLLLNENLQRETYNGIRYNTFFIARGQMFKYIKNAIRKEESTQVYYNGLELITENNDASYGHIEVKSNNTAEEKKLIKGVYGVENPGKGKRIYVLRPDIVLSGLISNTKRVIVRACYFLDNQNFFALDGGVDLDNGSVRGVRR